MNILFKKGTPTERNNQPANYNLERSYPNVDGCLNAQILYNYQQRLKHLLFLVPFKISKWSVFLVFGCRAPVEETDEDGVHSRKIYFNECKRTQTPTTIDGTQHHQLIIQLSISSVFSLLVWETGNRNTC